MTPLKNARRFLWETGVALTVLLGLAACGANTIPTRDTWYGQHYAIMQEFEKTLYRTLSEEGKKGFQDLFWASRDPAARTVFLERMSYIVNAYKRENARQPWNTDRGRVYILNGPPASIEIDQNTNWGIQLSQTGQGGAGAIDRSNEDVQANRAEVWTYSVQSQYAKYIFTFRAPNEWKLLPAAVAGNQYIGRLETHGKTIVFGVLDPEAYRKAVEALAKNK